MNVKNEKVGSSGLQVVQTTAFEFCKDSYLNFHLLHKVFFCCCCQNDNTKKLH